MCANDTQKSGEQRGKLDSLVRCRACCEMVELKKTSQCVGRHQAKYHSEPSFWKDVWECPKCGERGQTPNDRSELRLKEENDV